MVECTVPDHIAGPVHFVEITVSPTQFDRTPFEKRFDESPQMIGVQISS